MSSSLSPILYLFLIPAGVLYQKVQHLLAEDETTEGSHPSGVIKHRRPGPKHPVYSIQYSHFRMVHGDAAYDDSERTAPFGCSSIWGLTRNDPSPLASCPEAAWTASNVTVPMLESIPQSRVHSSLCRWRGVNDIVLDLLRSFYNVYLRIDRSSLIVIQQRHGLPTICGRFPCNALFAEIISFSSSSS